MNLRGSGEGRGSIWRGKGRSGNDLNIVLTYEILKNFMKINELTIFLSTTWEEKYSLGKVLSLRNFRNIIRPI